MRSTVRPRAYRSIRESYLSAGRRGPCATARPRPLDGQSTERRSLQRYDRRDRTAGKARQGADRQVRARARVAPHRHLWPEEPTPDRRPKGSDTLSTAARVQLGDCFAGALVSFSCSRSPGLDTIAVRQPQAVRLRSRRFLQYGRVDGEQHGDRRHEGQWRRSPASCSWIQDLLPSARSGISRFPEGATEALDPARLLGHGFVGRGRPSRAGFFLVRRRLSPLHRRIGEFRHRAEYWRQVLRDCRRRR